MMKKVFLGFVLVAAMCLCAHAQDGFFQESGGYEGRDGGGGGDTPRIPAGEVGKITDTDAPLGTGLFILTALGAGYAIKRKRK